MLPQRKAFPYLLLPWVTPCLSTEPPVPSFLPCAAALLNVQRDFQLYLTCVQVGVVSAAMTTPRFVEDTKLERECERVYYNG